jgi:putative DNA primase/helicase
LNDNVTNLEDYRVRLNFNRKLPLAIGSSASSKQWNNTDMYWSDLVQKLRTPTRTPETMAQYEAYSKPQKDRAKDIGGFVGGSLHGGRRKVDQVTKRSILTLDADFPADTFLDDIRMLSDFAWCIYSTHSHRADHPRYRLLIPLSSDITPEQYGAISRRVAEQIGIDQFDDTTFEVNRLMYWPSCPCDAPYEFDYADEKFLDPKRVLDTYDDWQDVSFWPESDRAKSRRKHAIGEKQKDPLQKKGLIGAFCRAYYPIQTAIEKFLSEVYEPTGKEDRWTFIPGSTTAGLVIYDDKFAYSNHGTDPAGGQTCNAFDLVRIHLFGNKDQNTVITDDTDPKSLPSFKAMEAFCLEDKECRIQRIKDHREEAKEDFDDGYEMPEDTEEDKEWESDLDQGKGGIKPTLNNARKIMLHDPMFKSIRYNSFRGQIEITGDVPWEHDQYWRDADDAHLEVYLSLKYAEFAHTKVATALTDCTDRQRFHPVKEYLEGLPKWDGVPRVETLLIDYLGADDNSYVRAVMRKTLCAAVRRIYHPGTKFDYTLVLVGPQGIGKSTIAAKLGGEWFTDNLSLSDTRDKTAAEKLQGEWIIEIPELSGMRKMDVETLKSFLSRVDDKYRASYGKRVESHPRQCIFIGTTNAEDGFLRDTTGGRRFWPVHVPGNPDNPPFKITKDLVDQIWAEVLILEKDEDLILTGDDLEMAMRMQKESVEFDPREGRIRAYLDMKLPANWVTLNASMRQDYVRDHLDDDILDAYEKETRCEDDDDFNIEDPINPEPETRRYVCLQEIWTEALDNPMSKMSRGDSYALASIMGKLPNWKNSGKSKRFPIYGKQKYWVREG